MKRGCYYFKMGIIRQFNIQHTVKKTQGVKEQQMKRQALFREACKLL